MKLGTTVRVIRPDYAEGLVGTVEGRELECDRWIIRLNENPLDEEDEPIRLSLARSDFVVIESHQ